MADIRTVRDEYAARKTAERAGGKALEKYLDEGIFDAEDKTDDKMGNGKLDYLGHMAGDDVTREGHNNVPLTGQQGFGMIGSMAPMRYMGHFAGDDVMREGHNTVPKSAVSKKISHLVKSEGKPQKQAVAMALNMQREGRLTKEGGYKRVKKDK